MNNESLEAYETGADARQTADAIPDTRKNVSAEVQRLLRDGYEGKNDLCSEFPLGTQVCLTRRNGAGTDVQLHCFLGDVLFCGYPVKLASSKDDAMSRSAITWRSYVLIEKLTRILYNPTSESCILAGEDGTIWTCERSSESIDRSDVNKLEQFSINKSSPKEHLATDTIDDWRMFAAKSLFEKDPATFLRVMRTAVIQARELHAQYPYPGDLDLTTIEQFPELEWVTRTGRVGDRMPTTYTSQMRDAGHDSITTEESMLLEGYTASRTVRRDVRKGLARKKLLQRVREWLRIS